MLLLTEEEPTEISGIDRYVTERATLRASGWLRSSAGSINDDTRIAL